MRLYPHWARARQGGLTAVGWSDRSVDDARQHAEQRLTKIRDWQTSPRFEHS